ncbi:MAG: UDP-2,3-diacylglucosamine diphosphatase [Longimicrobiales bacterium]
MNRSDFLVSDLHLGAAPPATEAAFLRFAAWLQPRAASLWIVGDLFDFWFEWGDLVPGMHFRTLAALRALVDAGVPVSLVGGNHDAWGGAFLRQHVGVAVVDGPLRVRLGGREALVAHGDGVGRGDLKYRTLKGVIRSRPAVAAFRLLHPEIGLGLARRVSTTGDKLETDSRLQGRAVHIREWARAQLLQEPRLGLVVCGHSHRAEVLEVRSDGYYVNAGDWLARFPYVEASPGEAPRLHYWDGSAADR